MTLRTGTADDAAALLELWRAAGSRPGVSDDVESIEQLCERDASALIVAEENGGVVGSIIAGWDGWRASMYRLAVHPDRRREGIALALVREAERRLRALGARRIGAIVVSTEAHAEAFWLAAGYEKDGQVGRFVRNIV